MELMDTVYEQINVRDGGKASGFSVPLRGFLAFIALAAVLAGIAVPSYVVKRNAARRLFEDLTFTRIAVEARQNIQKIEYGLRNGKDLEQFYNIGDILRRIQRCSSYVGGVYLIRHDDVMLYSLEPPDEASAALHRPQKMVFESANDYILLADTRFFDLLLPIYGADGMETAYIIIRLDSDVVLY